MGPTTTHRKLTFQRTVPDHCPTNGRTRTRTRTGLASIARVSTHAPIRLIGDFHANALDRLVGAPATGRDPSQLAAISSHPGDCGVDPEPTLYWETPTGDKKERGSWPRDNLVVPEEWAAAVR
jgi:hypothetical protein